MYDTLRSKYFWLNMSADVYSTVRYCQDCPRVGTKFKHQGQKKLFLPSGSLKFIKSEILGLPPGTWIDNQFVTIISSRYGKLTRAVLTPRVSFTHVFQILTNKWAIPYDIPDIMLSDNVQQFFRKFLIPFCQYLAVKTSTTKAYHLQTNGEVER